MSLFSKNGWISSKQINIGGVNASTYLKGDCRVLVSRDPVTERGIIVHRWHLSISCESRYPSWEEIKDARYSLLEPDLTMAMLLPPPDQYVNLHQNCFHLHEIPTE